MRKNKEQEEVRTFAPGKLLLIGEHSVVYGAPALGLPLNRGIEVTLRPGHGEIDVHLGPGLSSPELSAKTTPEELIDAALQDMADEVDIEIHLNIPPMCGFGTSAALGTALLRARALWLGLKPSLRQLWDAAMVVETAAHSKPSGVDPAIVIWQRPILFQRAPEISEPKIRAFPLGKPLHIIYGNCGHHGGAKQSINHLADLKKSAPKLTQAAIQTLTEATKLAYKTLKHGELKTAGQALDVAHGILWQALDLWEKLFKTLSFRARAIGGFGREDEWCWRSRWRVACALWN